MRFWALSFYFICKKSKRITISTARFGVIVLTETQNSQIRMYSTSPKKYMIGLVFLIFTNKLMTFGNTEFNTPPSCVITAPHVNAYYKNGNELIINAYATDIGGSGLPGEISTVEFYVDDQKIGESDTAVNNIYSYSWSAGNVGEYTINAKATDTEGKSFTSAGVMISVGTEDREVRGLSSGKGKYLGNVVRDQGIESTFTDYWNGVTSGNGGKWQTVERTRDVMRWTRGDEAYKLAKDNHLPYRYHTFAWGSQYPDWIKTLDPAEFQEEMEEFIAAAADRYPYIDQIDVINEALPGHQAATQYFIDGLGGEGESGYDWAVWMFKKAREYFPNSKLILNDFGIVSSSNNIRGALEMLQVLRDSALVDGFGAQAHHFSLDHMQPTNLKANLDLMANAGVPIYITEMDMRGQSTDELSQLASYQKLFPVLWEHPDVRGITLWGYVYGAMWVSDAGLVYSSSEERPAMEWLKGYMGQQEKVGYPFMDQTYIPVEDITLNITSDTLYIGDTLQLSASIIPDSATSQYISWESDNMGVITIHSDGMLVAKSEGSAVISASTMGKSVNHTLFVIDTVIQLNFRFEAEYYEDFSGGRIQYSSDEGGGLSFDYLKNGDWSTYLLEIDADGIYDFTARAATRLEGGIIEISIQDSVLNTANVEDDKSNGWDDWYTLEPVEIELEEGSYELKLSFRGSSSILFNLNWFEINYNRAGRYTSIPGIADPNFELKVYPNPFAYKLHIDYSLSSNSSVDIEVLDISGRVISSLVNNANQMPGNQTVTWNGAGVPNGIYFLKCIINKEVITKKIILDH